MVKFEWDEVKAESNFIKHGFSFQECKSAFLDKNGMHFYDEEHSENEDRYLLLSKNRDGIIAVISYTIREDKYRIISCRKANKMERKIYEEECKNN